MSVASLEGHLGKNTKALLRGMTALAPFVILARALTSGGQLIAGRLLGPREFGLVNVVLAVAAVLSIPFQGFIAAMVKYVSMKESPQAQAEIASTALWLHLAWTALCCLAFIAARRLLAGWLRVDGNLFYWGVAYTFVLSVYAMISALPQAVLRFRERGLVELIYGGASVAVFLAVFYLAGMRGYEGFLIGLLMALAIAGLTCAYWMRGCLRLAFSRCALRPLVSYFFPTLINACAAAATQAAIPLVLAAWASVSQVGFFSIYELGSIGVAAVLSQIIGIVLPPMVTLPARQEGAWKKFFLVAVPLAVGAFLFFCPVQFVVLKLVGKNYPLRADWILLFSATATCVVLYGVASILLSSRDVPSAWLGTGGSVINGLTLVLAAIWAVPRHGFVGAIAALLISYAASLAWYCGWGLTFL